MARKRVVTSKPTRNGCKTCRYVWSIYFTPLLHALTSVNSLRKVKCDETQPNCLKCSSVGRECDYGVRVISGTSSRALLPAPHLNPGLGKCPPRSTPLRSLSPRTPVWTSISSFATAEDKSAYDFFLNVSLNEIGATSPSGDEWIRIALQHSALKPIFHAIAAVGKAHASQCRVSHLTLVRLVQPADLNAAMNHYSKAVSALRLYIDDIASKQAPMEPLLIACLLLTCYEVLIDRKGTASRHYRLGRRIFERSLGATTDVLRTRSSSTSTTKQIAAAFMSLGRGGEYYWKEYEKADNGPQSIRPYIPGMPPTAYTSFVEADVHLEAIVRFGEEVRDEMVQLAQARIKSVHGESLDLAVSFCLANCLSRSIDLPFHLQNRLQEVKSAHLRWLRMLQKSIPQQGQTGDKILLLTQIRYFASWLVISTCRETREVAIDRFEHDFIRVLDMAETYFREMSGQPLPMRPSEMREAVGLSFEGGILPALHLIACKSRSSAIRRRATRLLITADRQEGTCHSGVIGHIVGCAADLEEGRTRLLQGDKSPVSSDYTCDQIPEEARFADSVIKGESGLPPSFELVCARYLHDHGEKIEVTEYCGKGLSLKVRFLGVKVFDFAN